MTTNNRRVLMGAAALLVVGVLLYWLYCKFYVNTDDAYVNANVVHIAPRVTGQVAHVYIENNKHVEPGQLLFDLDPEIFAASVMQAEANLAISEAKLKMAELTAERTAQLVKKKVASAQAGDTATTDLQAASASVQLARANLVTAQLNERYTRVTAPASGWVTNVSLRVGDIVMANQAVFVLISNQDFWIDANFKETELRNIRPGQLANIKLDMYPKHQFKGIVDSMSYGSGSVFSLFPPENATGNWVKVTQRIPVRVRITNPDPTFSIAHGCIGGSNNSFAFLIFKKI